MTEREEGAAPKLSFRSRVIHLIIRLIVVSMYRVGRLFRLIRKRREIDEGADVEVLLTGSFHSDSWIKAFILPLVAAERCRNVTLVTTFQLPEQPGINVIVPGNLSRRVFGEVLARLLTFTWQAMRRRSELVGGFYISPNALFSELVASMTGARSMYFCVGGPMEIIDGGLHGESRIFEKLTQPDAIVEKHLLRSIREFDVIVPMGSGAVRWFEENGVSPRRITKMTGAVDSSRFSPPLANRATDLVFVGRLAAIKDIGLLLRAVRLVADSGRAISLRIVGKGPQEAELRELVTELRLDQFVEFAGYVPDVVVEFENAKCFVLTSRSEGVSLAMIEAMLGGAVPVVADVGDLGDLVHDGENGFLVDSRDPQDFANCINDLLDDESKLSKCSLAAYNTGLRYDIEHIANDWNTLLGEVVR